MKRASVFLTVVVVLGVVASANAETVTIDFVTVGNPGNAADPQTGRGSVADTFLMGKYEVTAGQYAAFLNAKAGSDSYGLYNTLMWSSYAGCKIERTGEDGSYTYSVSNPDMPVTHVNFWNACRFVNWLHNGQGSGDTEDGVYTLTTATMADNTVTRNPGAKYFIPNQDEWYKAAYHDAANGTYYTFPTSSNDQPANLLPDPGNSANYYIAGVNTGRGPLTAVGSFNNSASPYGTFDQAGNVIEWTETILSGATNCRILRGGEWNWTYYSLRKSDITGWVPGHPGDNNAGSSFRVAATIPEPGAAMLCLVGAICLLWRRR
ncbi:MAG: formylglycine-generating enzyme family protein [Pirellulaceae bacterium]|nr:formylglycine-generating enzyme family protein [Pirellulaceae bacterium]